MREAKFEVQLQKDGRWILEEIHDRETPAVKSAKVLVQTAECEAVRVLKDTRRHDGLHMERVIFQEEAQHRSNTIFAGHLETAPPCNKPEDLFNLPARMIGQRVLRRYLDHENIVFSELLYQKSYRRRFVDHMSNIHISAIDHVAAAQARTCGENERDLREKLFRLIDQAQYIANQAEGVLDLHDISLKNYTHIVQSVQGLPEPTRTLAIRSAAARSLSEAAHPMGKLQLVLSQVSGNLERRDLAVLDSLVADLLATPSVVQELLGPQNNLCEAIIAMIDIMEGVPTPGQDETETVQMLKYIFKSGKFPQGAATLLERIRREVKSNKPLHRNDPSQEDKSLMVLIDRLTSRDDVLGGYTMAEALTDRYMKRITEGGTEGWFKAIAGMLDMLQDNLKKIHFLILISESKRSEPHLSGIANSIRDMLDFSVDLHDFVDRYAPQEDKMRTLSNVQRRLMGSSLPLNERQYLFDKVDEMLYDYLMHDGVIENLDDASLPLHKRALTLIKFCGSGALLEGKALNLARQRVVSHLKQPKFVENYTQFAQTAQEKEQMVRELKDELAKAGFQMA